ncbi:MAG: Ger(x)C family spore germination protein [Bacilli bacterium]|nr:Ger(x)C family spore germination protein [Bacilli bacterium]
MIKKLVIFLTLLLVTGCWDYRELNDLAIVGSLSIDIVDDEFVIAAQIMNAKKEGGSGNSSSGSTSTPIVVYKFSANTISNTLRKMTTESPRKLYIGHIAMVLISENAAKIGFKEISDFLLRDHESRKQFKVLIIKDNPVDQALSILDHLETLTIQATLNSLNNASSYYGNVTPIGFDEFIALGFSKGIEGIIPYAILEGDPKEGEKKESTEITIPQAKIILKGLSVFKDDKLIGFLDDNDSIGFNFLMGNLKSAMIPFKCDEKNYATTEIINYKTDMKIEIKNDLPVVKIKVTGEANQAEINCNVDMEVIEGRDFIMNLMNEEIKRLMSNSIDNVKENFGSDIFGFERYLYRHNYKYWKKVEKKWDELFKKIEYEIDVNFMLAKKGSTLDSIKGVNNGE